MKKHRNNLNLTRAGVLALTAALAAMSCVVPALAEEDEPKDSTGTDPRAFTSKFMPYALHTELENGGKVNQFDLW